MMMAKDVRKDRMEGAAGRVLLIEDNLTTSKTLVLFLEAEGYQVDCAFAGREGLDAFARSSFDLVVLDLMLPDMDGLAVCASLRADSDVPIVMLTARTTDEEIVEGLEHGADDYVGKPFAANVLLARIRRCLARGRRAREPAAQVIRLGELEVDVERRKASLGTRALKLTKSEFDILAVLIRQRGRVFTRQQLIDHALGADYEGFDRTIDTHIWSLRKKLNEPRGKPRFIRSELGVGYRMSDDHEN